MLLSPTSPGSNIPSRPWLLGTPPYSCCETRHCSGQLQTWVTYQDNQSHHCSSIIKAAASIRWAFTFCQALHTHYFLWTSIQETRCCDYLHWAEKKIKTHRGSKWTRSPSWKGWSPSLTQAVGFIPHPFHQSMYSLPTSQPRPDKTRQQRESNSVGSQGQLCLRNRAGGWRGGAGSIPGKLADMWGRNFPSQASWMWNQTVSVALLNPEKPPGREEA